jgi:glycosyltransferase involved in cell wall biosynthesis
VLWLTKGLGRGGAERLLVDALPWIDRERFAIEVAYLLPWKDALVEAVERQGVAVHCLGGGRAWDLRWVNRLRRLVGTGRFDLIHTHLPYPAFGARLALASPRPVLVHTEHNVWDRHRTLTRAVNARTYGSNAAVIAVSEAVAASIRRPAGVGTWPPVHVVIHGIDPAGWQRGPDVRSATRAELGFAADDLVVGTVGNLTLKKDHRTLLAAFAQLVGAEGRARLVLVGAGPLEDALRTYAAQLGVSDQMVFAGSRGDVPDLLSAFDVFALSSRYEGLPIALIEAMAAGLPVVATDVGGVAEVVDDGRNGYLVEEGDPSALATRLAKLLADPLLRQRLGADAAARAADFTMGPAVVRTMEIYDEALAR